MVITHNGKTITDSNPLPVKLAGSGAPSSELYTGTVNVTDTAAALGSQEISEVFLQVDATNTEDVYVGNADDQLFVLPSGSTASITLAVTNLDLVYVKTAANTATLYYLARS